MVDQRDKLLTLIESRRASIGIIGLGYVGIVLATAFLQAGFSVLGIEIDQKRLAALKEDVVNLERDRDDLNLQKFSSTKDLKMTDNFAALECVDIICICVPTPLLPEYHPDTSHMIQATQHIAKYLHPGQIVILESTSYPGTTEELVLPLLEKTSLKVGHDFFLAFSPERIDPGNHAFNIKNTTKLVSGITPRCCAIAMKLYHTIAENLVEISSVKTAELVKLYENTFRAVNIGLVNELAQIANILGVNIWEVIDAAATKPFGFMPFYPGPGVGGHCIPVDPHYLAWKLRTLGYRSRFIELASEINEEMPKIVVEQIIFALNEHGKPPLSSHIVVLGVAYKRDVPDVRESPALTIIQMLRQRTARVDYVDDYVQECHLSNETIFSVQLSEELLHTADCVVILTDHSHIDYDWVVNTASLVVDTRNATGHLPAAENVWRLAQTRKGTARQR